MYQYKAILKSTQATIAEGHSIGDIEKAIVHFKRKQKKGEHTHGNDGVEIYHVKRDPVSGKHKDELIKIVQ